MKRLSFMLCFVMFFIVTSTTKLWAETIPVKSDRLIFSFFLKDKALYNNAEKDRVKFTPEGLRIEQNELKGMFTSEVITASIPFSDVGVHWKAEVPIGTEILIEIRTSKDGNVWTKWQKIVCFYQDVEQSFFSSLVGINQKDRTHQYIQYRLIFLSDDEQSFPTLKSIEIIFIDAGVTPPNLLNKIKRERESRLGIQSFAQGASYPKPFVVSRAGWGCDESKMTWPPQYETVTHNIIHHTVTPNTDTDWPKRIRSIYHYHAVELGWGDIGYNYLVDPNGVLYEGRYGGDDVIGAHAYRYNDGTMGLAFLGTYTNTNPSSAMLNSAEELLAWKCDQRNIDPLGSGPDNDGAVYPYICGHRDVGNTECPGDKLYNQLPTIRTNVRNLLTGRPNPPSNLVAPSISSADGTNVVLEWKDNSSDEQGFKIERKTGVGGTWSQIGTVGANTTRYLDASVSTNQVYYYRVRAYNASGDSDYSNECYAITLAPPSELTGTRVSSTKINLRWKDNATLETGYMIQRKDDPSKDWSGIALLPANSSSYSDTGLLANTTYYYTVVACVTTPVAFSISNEVMIPPVRTLTVASSNPNSGVSIAVSPNDNNGQGNGTTQFTRIYNHGTVVTLAAPSTAGGNNFQKWQRNGVDYSTNQTVTMTIDADYTMTAVYVTPHTVTITSGPTANPPTIPSGGTTNLSVSATDSYGHSVNYSWTVNPNEGNFTPNPNTQNPTWTAPANNTCADKTYTFTVTATCSVDPSVKKTGTVQVIVKPAPHTVTITSGPTANPNPIDSGSTTSLSVTAIDSCGHNINYSWTVNPNEGNFTPNPNTQNPTWTAPANDTCADKTYTFTVTATCSVDSNVKDTKTVQVTVKPEPHTVTITSGPTANPTTINSGGVTNLNVSATDSCGHSVNYSWTVNPNEGSFSPNPNTQNPTWTAPENNTDADKIYTFTATATCSVDSNVKDTGTVQVKVKPKPHDSPTITAINPNSCCQGTDNLNIVITGTNFQNGATVTFSGTGITINSTTVDSDTQITLEIDVTSTAEASSRNVTVTNPDSRSGTLEDGFTVYATPTITKITPNEVAQGETVDMVITGTGFQDGLTVNFCNGVTKNSTTVDSSTQITVNITVSQMATLDQCQVTVTNPGGCEGSGVFTITPQCGCFADIDCDGDVDIVDIQKVAGRWNTKCGDDRYVADYDIDKDCDIDIVDIQKVAGHWGETGPPWERCTQTPAPQRELQNALSTLIKLKADKSKVRVGERVRIIVQIERAVNLGAAEFRIPITFDGSFAVRKIEMGSFPKRTGNTVIPLKSDSSSNREITFGFVSLGENKAPSGNGVLASIELEAQAQGKVTFELSNVQITDKMGNPLPVSIDAPLQLWAIEIPTKSTLLQNFPNPFNPETWIPYKLAFASNVEIQIYNKKGQLVRRLSLGRKEAGYYLDKASAAYWDGKNEMGEPVSSGIYFYQIRAGEFHAVRKMVISK